MGKQFTKTSWQPVAKWYSKLVDDKGHYYHEHVILPGVLKLLAVSAGDSLLDLACGQGILGRSVPGTVSYTGVDIAPDLISYARKADHHPKHTYRTHDVTHTVTLGETLYSHAAIILALQNIENTAAVLANASSNLKQRGTFVIVLNHPAFRIPRQSAWGIDEANKLQYRKVNRYLSPLKIPITMHPGQKQSVVTWSFHQPISYYVQSLTANGFVVDAMDEWASDKESQGSSAKMENRSRSEIPLFLAIRARKI